MLIIALRKYICIYEFTYKFISLIIPKKVKSFGIMAYRNSNIIGQNYPDVLISNFI